MSNLKTISTQLHSDLTQYTLCKPNFINEYIYVNATVTKLIEFKGVTHEVQYSTGNGFYSNDYDAPRNDFEVTVYSSACIHSLYVAYESDFDDENNEDLKEISEHLSLTFSELFELRTYIKDETPKLSDFDLSDDVNDYLYDYFDKNGDVVEVAEYGDFWAGDVLNITRKQK